MKIRKIRLFSSRSEKAINVSKIVEEEIKKTQFELSEDEFDLGIAIGGDGSFLRMIYESNYNKDTLYVGINAGTLGFAQDIRIDEISTFLNQLTEDNYDIEEVGIATIRVKRKEQESIFHCLNEIVIRDEELNVLEANIQIEGHTLENYAGDGILISTSFGSTAYNLSYGGSIVSNEIDSLQITPIAPLKSKSYQTLTNSLIIPSTKKVIMTPKNKNIILTIDGRNKKIDEIDKIIVSIDSHIKVIRKKDYSYIRKINDKFIK